MATTTATLASPIGQYPIMLTGGPDNNYALTLVNSTLTVIGEPLLVVWTNDFSSAPMNAALGGNASVTNGVLQLTAASLNQNGQLFIPSLGWPLRAFHVEFDLLIGGGTGADAIWDSHSSSLQERRSAGLLIRS